MTYLTEFFFFFFFFFWPICSSGSRRPNAARERSRVQSLRDGIYRFCFHHLPIGMSLRSNQDQQKSHTVICFNFFFLFLGWMFVMFILSAFQSLQSALPAVPPSTKLSKLDVLLMASAYIAHLGRLVQEDNDEQQAHLQANNSTNQNNVTFHPVKVIFYSSMWWTLYRINCLTIRVTNVVFSLCIAYRSGQWELDSTLDWIIPVLIGPLTRRRSTVIIIQGITE